MSNLPTQFKTDEWITASWDEYLQAVRDRAYENAKFYYYRGKIRVEMTPQGFDHSSDNFSIGAAIALFSGLKNIPLTGVTNCTFRKSRTGEAQPDLGFYIGERAEMIPPDTTIVDLESYPPPDLAIEIAKTSLSDDIGVKRMLYEGLNVKEYWVVNVREAKLIAFAIADGGSKQISQSEVLPALPFTLLEEALQRSRETGRGQLYAWLIAQIQTLENS
ncbi:Uma2 family endonuclease [Phormidium sp. CCY1219]|uniref:Uma2 family endonuclease n=1 Tax=Phormidium sp. CCY1219 TaxID=2886104 RepID=UPI002D1ED758|nr:Uma2 family endonuclease [Phormidium sp. CCY1219]MEB3830936.1 Uma2 family endonuclease [Phormidium sp. CCY1219]